MTNGGEIIQQPFILIRFACIKFETLYISLKNISLNAADTNYNVFLLKEIYIMKNNKRKYYNLLEF